MAAAVDEAAQLLEVRRDELLTELKGIEQALQALGGPMIGPAQRQTRGQRQNELLQYLEANSNAKPKDVADALGISRPNASNLLSRMRKQKLIRRTRGGGYSVSRSRPESATR